MVKLKLTVVFFILFLPVQCFSWIGAVYNITDGDTIKVLRNGQIVKIRLYGIDTPEKTQAQGMAAKIFLQKIIKPGVKVSIESINTDHYGRTVGIVEVQATGLNINQTLVKNGYAWVYIRYCKKAFCRIWKDLENKARGLKIGLWIDSDPVPPWEYRRLKHN
ncbi:thermonuclease family protein [Desulfospira joergensenii]|uniref:thermonuclease family protein n=1 Tax=Desulfospira joergensenii TaxID=53329 RepID=UPI0003B48B25|nr:thermonuclease family protein [Desulfospira joergensenii]